MYLVGIYIHLQVVEESSDSEPESPGIDPLVFSRDDFDTGRYMYSELFIRLVAVLSQEAHVSIFPRG